VSRSVVRVTRVEWRAQVRSQRTKYLVARFWPFVFR
jgi:hypothetical protein